MLLVGNDFLCCPAGHMAAIPKRTERLKFVQKQQRKLEEIALEADSSGARATYVLMGS